MSELPSYSALAGADVAAIYGLMTKRAESVASMTYEFTWQRDQALLEATDGALGDAATGLTGAEARKPQWLDGLVQRELRAAAETNWSRERFVRIRLLERLGLVALEPDDTYVLAMISAIGPNKADTLRADPELVEKALWRVFEVEGGGEVSLTNVDLFGGEDWRNTFLELTADGLAASVPATVGFALKQLTLVQNLSRPVFSVKLPEYPILKLSPDGKRLYVAVTGLKPDRPIRVYDVDSGRLIDSIKSAPLEVVGGAAPGALSPDGSTFAVATGAAVVRVDTATLNFVGPALLGDTGDAIGRLEYSHDGSRLAAATGNGNVLVWDTGTGALRHRFVEGGASWGLDFSADDRTVHSVGGGNLTSWDLTGERGLFSVGKASVLADYAVSTPAPDGRTLVRERLGLRWFVDDQTGHETAKVPKDGNDSDQLWSPDSRWLLSWRDGGTLRLWEAATGGLVAQRPLAGDVVPVFSPSSAQVYVNVIDESILLVLDAATLKPARAPIELSTPVLDVVPHPDDGSVFAVARDGAVLRVQPGTGSVALVAPTGTFPPGTFGVEVSPDGPASWGPTSTQTTLRCSWSTPPPGNGSAPRPLGTPDLAPSTCPRTAPSSPRCMPTGSGSSTEPPACPRAPSRCRR